MKRRIEILLILSLLTVLLGIFAIGIFFIYFHGNPDAKTIPLWIKAPMVLSFNGFLIVSFLLWINECALRWEEDKKNKKDIVDRFYTIGWLIIFNIYGAYYFSIRRIIRALP